MNDQQPDANFDAMDLDIAAGLVDGETVLHEFRRAARRMWAVAQMMQPLETQERIAEVIEQPGWNIRLVMYLAEPESLDIRVVTRNEAPLPDDDGVIIVQLVKGLV